MIGCFPALSRGNVSSFKDCSEHKAKTNRAIYAATGCGFFFQLQQLLVVGFCTLLTHGLDRWSPLRRSFSSWKVLAESLHPHSLGRNSMLCFCVAYILTPKGALTMEWVTPQHEEIDLNCEVSSYANAEL